MSKDEHIDPFDYVDKRGMYYDCYDVVFKNAAGELWITRTHCDFLPGDPPYMLTCHAAEEIPLEALTIDSRIHVERIAAALAGGDRPVDGQSYAHYDEGTDVLYGKAALANPEPYILYASDQIWKRVSGEVVIVRQSARIPPNGLFTFSEEEIVPLTMLTEGCCHRVLELAIKLEASDIRWSGKSSCIFKWKDDRGRMVSPSNYRITLRNGSGSRS